MFPLVYYGFNRRIMLRVSVCLVACSKSLGSQDGGARCPFDLMPRSGNPLYPFTYHECEEQMLPSLLISRITKAEDTQINFPFTLQSQN